MDLTHEDAEAAVGVADPTGEAREEVTIGTRGKTVKRATAEAETAIVTEVVEVTDAARSASEAAAVVEVEVGTRSAEVHTLVEAIAKVTGLAAETTTSTSRRSFRPTTIDSMDFATAALAAAAAAPAPEDSRSLTQRARVLTELGLQSELRRVSRP